MDTCVFCKVVDREAPASVIYDDEATLAFMDLRQPTWPEGVHALVVPKQHVEQVDELEPELAGLLMATVVKVARSVRRCFAPDGMSIWSSNGPAAFQEVPHVHMHVLTRTHEDGLLRVYAERPPHPPTVDLDEVAATIRTDLA
ncbi:HIT domain-containing protein [Actinopolymorpha sp. B11F2]|uniref:HIT family protein n=1 Tax=Actinopolymorpha sp. B11F2 TaxID=3160862 RepID=UPI0032E49352